MPFSRALITLCLALLATAPAWANPVRIALKNGDVVHGELSRQDETELIVKHRLFGELTVPRAEIRSFVIGEAAVARADAPKAAPAKPAPPPDHGLLGLGWLKDWNRRLEAGVNGAAGVSSNQQAHVGFMADFESAELRWQQRARFFRSESDGEETANSAMVSITRDDLMPGSPWFGFAGGQFDRDEFQDWRNRLAANGGVGYQFAQTDSYRLLGRFGLGATHSWGGPAGEDTSPEALIGVDMNWKISRRQSVVLTNAFYPSLNQGGEFRNVTTFDWIIDLDKEAGLGLKIGVNNEHESEREDGLDKNDFKYTSSLIWRL